MNAMDNASKNAQDLIDNFTLVMNKLRQAQITRELTEIVGTSEALK
jgi:F-type H+-transporting ATPase subunit gamma